MSQQQTEILQQLVDIMSYKDYLKEKFKFNTNDFYLSFPEPYQLNPNRRYVLYLKRFSVYNTIFNVDATNNIFTYTPTGAAPWKTITITPGAYEIKHLNTIIQTQMKANGDYDSTANVPNPYYITLAADEATSKSVMTIASPYKVDFTVANSLNKILGFDPQIYSSGTNISQNLILITSTNDIDIHCSWVTNGSYVNGVRYPILYSASAYTVKVGAKIIVSEINPIYLPLELKRLDDIRIQLKDDNGKLINFNGETVIVEIIIQQV